jgi:hypothetical protein
LFGPLIALSLTAAPVGYLTDAGFASDAGEQGLLLDSSDTSDGGRHAEELIAPRVNVRIEGAQMLPPEVYLDMLRLPDDARPNEATAASVQKQLLEYLQRTGFELASVGAGVEDKQIVVRLDEGHIDRIIYLGNLSFQQVRFKLALSLPANVFNRPLFDRQVRELAESMGMVGVRWELIRTGEVDHAGPQLDTLPTPINLSMEGAPMVHARLPYEVRIHFPTNANGTGLGLNIRNSGADGFETGVNNRWGGLFFEGDRFLVGGGVGLRSRVDTEKLYPNFSRAYTMVRYDTPPIAKRFRPNFWAQNDWLSRQRGDLYLENYWAVVVAAALQLELEASPGLHFLFGSGFEWRRLFGYQTVLTLMPPPTVARYENVDRIRPLVRLTAEWVVDPDVIRWDRRHVLEGEARQYIPVPNQPETGFLDLNYQLVHPFGWHDLWIKSRLHASWGDVTFHDEMSLGHFTRNVFASQYIAEAVNLSVEFRFSISRDVVKLSFFHDLALFANPDRELGTAAAQLADAFGPGINLLLQDMFQLDMYMAFGFRRGPQFGAAFNLQLQKAF